MAGTFDYVMRALDYKQRTEENAANLKLLQQRQRGHEASLELMRQEMEGRARMLQDLQRQPLALPGQPPGLTGRPEGVPGPLGAEGWVSPPPPGVADRSLYYSRPGSTPGSFGNMTSAPGLAQIGTTPAAPGEAADASTPPPQPPAAPSAGRTDWLYTVPETTRKFAAALVQMGRPAAAMHLLSPYYDPGARAERSAAELMGGLVRHGDILDEESRRELHGTAVQRLVEAGQFADARSVQEAATLEDLQRRQRSRAPAEEPEADDDAESAMPGLDLTPEAEGQDRVRMGHLRQRQRELEQQEETYRPLSHSARFKKLHAATEQELTTVRKEQRIIESRTDRRRRYGDLQARRSVQDAAAKARRAAKSPQDVEHWMRMTEARLAFLAAGSGSEAAQAKVALEELRQLRSTGVEGGRKRKRTERRVPVGAEPGPEMHRGEKPFAGQGEIPEAKEKEEADMPQIKSFRRVR